MNQRLIDYTLARQFTKFGYSATNDFFEGTREKLFDRTGVLSQFFPKFIWKKGRGPSGDRQILARTASLS